MSKSLRIAIAEDEDELLVDLEETLHEFGHQVVAKAKNGRELVQLCRETKPDLVVTDIKMPDMDGIECAKRIRSGETELKIIVLTQFGDKGLIEKLRKFDVDGYLLKKSSKEEIVQAIRTVQKNEKYYSEEIKAKISNSRDRASRFDYLKCKFSKREEQVLELICKGYSNIEIANFLGVSSRTVDGFRARLFEKTGAKNAPNLVMFAIKNGLVN